MNAEMRLEKTWIKRGELRGFCGKFAGRYFAMVRRVNLLLVDSNR
jgi:hypothetical protein